MQVKIRFEGICTYFEDFTKWVAGIDVRHRMVLVNANITSIQNRKIVPHLAQMQVAGLLESSGLLPSLVGDSTDLYDLNGDGAYTITVANPVDTQGWTNDAGCLPSLQNAIPPDRRPIGLPKFEVVAGGEAACYVDFTHGTIAGYAVAATSDPASGKRKAISIVTIETKEEPRISITTWKGGAGELILSDGALVTISNAPSGGGDDREEDRKDFSLHFLTVMDPPTDPRVPDKIDCPPLPEPPPRDSRVWGEAGPGCSNTNYP